MMKWDEVKTIELAGGIQRQVLTTRNIMLVRHLYPAGTAIPHHTHPQEQITIVEEGYLYYEVEEKGYELEPGDVISVPSNAQHGGQNKVLDYLLPEAKTLELMEAQPPDPSMVAYAPARHKKKS
jgi:gentisate 1,2-dioxygenase